MDKLVAGPCPNLSVRAPYRLAWPRANFFTFGFFDPRAESRGFFGFSAFAFLRDARLLFFRSSFVSFSVFAIIAFHFLFFLFCWKLRLDLFSFPTYFSSAPRERQDSYQGIALAIPQSFQLKRPLRG